MEWVESVGASPFAFVPSPPLKNTMVPLGVDDRDS
jgi:hypothetical protein